LWIKTTDLEVENWITNSGGICFENVTKIWAVAVAQPFQKINFSK
jgi:hypothetical protein